MKKKMRSISVALAVLFVAFTFISACNYQKHGVIAQAAKTESLYTCPMHPQILESRLGFCPVCGMALVKRSGQASESATISLNTVLQPVGSSVISGVKAITPAFGAVKTTVSAEGYLDFDARTFNNIASRFSGRIEKLYIKYAFQQIHKGQRIFDVYSPEMVTAQQGLIYLTKNDGTDINLINAAKQKLLLQGMTWQQVNQVIKTAKPFYSLPVYSAYEGHVHDMAHTQMGDGPGTTMPADISVDMPLAIKEGMYVETGQVLFNVVNPHKLWAVLKIDGDAISAIKLNQPVAISFPDIEGKNIEGKVNFIEPTLRAGEKDATARVYLENMDHTLKVNSLVTAQIQTGQTKALWVPRTALLNLGLNTIVWLKSGGIYQAHKVISGIVSGNNIEIKSGLKATDSVASNAQYLTDSESFIKVNGNEK
jgi:Cu(I)/Ag(I) efflux system membrane fusion protein